MAAASHTLNGPTGSMYKLKPYQTIQHVEVPDIMYKLKPYQNVADYNQRSTCSSTQSQPSKLGGLEGRQEDVLSRLQDMQAKVAELALRYNVKDTPEAPPASSSSQTTGVAKFVGEPGRTLEIVISTDPTEGVPLSLLVLSTRLAAATQTLLSTFLHSSVAPGDVPPKLASLLHSNGGRSRDNCNLAITLVWKKVSPSPQLVVDPVQQTGIHGEANMARYLWSLAGLNAGLDPVTSTQIDELVDLAQLQILDGNNKERAAALRGLNSNLGKERKWLVGGGAPSLADVVCWSAIRRAGLDKQGALPPNVARWVKGCDAHPDFATAVGVSAS